MADDFLSALESHGVQIKEAHVLKPGEVLIIQLARRVKPEGLQAIRALVKEELGPDFPVMVIDHDVKAMVVTNIGD